jgi:hypothetical protein
VPLLVSQFPEFRMEIESIVAEGEIVAARTVPRERLVGDRGDLSAMLHLGVLKPAGAPPNSLQPSASPPYAGELVTSAIGATRC